VKDDDDDEAILIENKFCLNQFARDNTAELREINGMIKFRLIIIGMAIRRLSMNSDKTNV